MTTPSAFVPADRRRALQKRVALPDRVQGAALFADVSGFSTLTRMLFELQGERGTEAVLDYIDPIYEAIVAVLYRYGGSVIGFSGDAITCWLDAGDSPSLMPVAQRAVACGLAMQRAMQPLARVELAPGVVSQLGLKVAMSLGPARRFLAGDPDFVVMEAIAGETVVRMAQGEALANAGDVVVSAEIVQLLQDQLTVSQWRGNFALVSQLQSDAAPLNLPLVTLDAQTADPWTLPPVRERLGQGAYLSELRTGASLFIKFSGIDYDGDDAAGEKLDRFVRWVEAILQRTRGYLIQLTIGDKGSYLHASYGVPRAFGDNAARAAAAAVALREAPDLLTFIDGVQIGISQGRMWAGAYGSQYRKAYSPMSDATNRAARLMSAAAPNQILIDGSLVAELTGGFRLTALAPIEVKGHNAPLSIWVLEGTVTTSTRLPEFYRQLVGRADAVARLAARWRAAVAGRGGVVLVRGVTGIGKSHLVAAFVGGQLGQRGRFAWASNDGADVEVVYAAWRRVFGALLNTADVGSTSAEITYAQLRQRLTPFGLHDDERLPLLADLLGIPVPAGRTVVLDPQVRHETWKAFAQTLLAQWTAIEPLLVVLDDAQWLGDISYELLRDFARLIADWRMLIIVIGREGSARWSELEVTETIQLEALNSAESEQLGAAILNAPLTPLLADLVARQTDGNPFFIESLLATMRLAGQIERVEDVWRLSNVLRTLFRNANAIEYREGERRLAIAADLNALRLGLPDSIHNTVMARIDRLSPQPKLTLKVASVIGQHFRYSLLNAAYPQPIAPRALLDDLEHLTAEALVTMLDERQYGFRHQTTQEVAYDMLLYSQRQALHRQVAHALQNLDADATGAIGHHALAGGLWRLALRCFLTMGARARQLFANHQSVANYEKALSCLANLSAQEQLLFEGEVRVGLGESLVQLGRYVDAQRHLESVLGLTEPASELHARAHRWLGRLCELQGRHEEAIEWLARGLEVSGSRTESAEMLAILGLIEVRRGNFDAARAYCQENLSITERLDAAAIRGRTFTLLAIINRIQGEHNVATAYGEQALAAYRSIGHRRGEALALNELAVNNVEHGSWRMAVEAYTQARQMFVETGDVYNRILTDNNLGNIARDQGRLADALASYAAALASLEQIGGSPYVKGAIRLNYGAAYLKRGDLARAAAEFEAAQRLFEAADVRIFLSELNRYRATLALRSGDVARASEHAQTALRLALEMSMRTEEGYATFVLGQIDAERGAWDSAEMRFRSAIAIFEEVEDPYGTANAKLALARRLLSTGRSAEARQCSAEALEQLKSIDAVALAG